MVIELDLEDLVKLESDCAVTSLEEIHLMVDSNSETVGIVVVAAIKDDVDIAALGHTHIADYTVDVGIREETFEEKFEALVDRNLRPDMR